MDLEALAAATPSPTADTFTAIVVRADESGLWVVEEGGDPRNPVGPCRGGWTANGTRTPVGAVVALTYTETDPWVVGFDNPALAIPDGDLAPFQNPSLENTNPGGIVPTSDRIAPGWGDFWSFGRRGDGPGKYDIEIDTTGGAHGANSLKVTGRGTHASVTTNFFSVPPGSSLELIAYAKAVGPDAFVNMVCWSSNPAAGESNGPGPFASGAQASSNVFYPEDGGSWIRYRAIVTLPPGDTRVGMIYDLGSDNPATDATVWLDAVDVNVVDIDPAAAHQEIMRRAALVLAGGGTRTVTAGGTVAWSQAFTIAGIGFRDDEATAGRFEIAQPANGTVIPVHSSTARTSHTVAGGVIALNADDALWYELPLGAGAASQPGRFHILGSTNDDGYVVPPHWVLVVRRTAWSASAHGLEYVWGDGNQQDPWRTPSLNAGWIEGTLAPRFTKTQSGLVVMRGRVRNGAGSAFTLPPGYVPTTQHEAIVRDGAGAGALVTVTTGGVVTTAGSNTDHSIATSFAALGG